MQIDNVINACQVLTKTGKTPTIALVKTILRGKTPLAVIVKGIQQFQAMSALGEPLIAEIELSEQYREAETTEQSQCGCEDRITSLEKKMSQMTGYITRLQAQVKDLTAQ